MFIQGDLQAVFDALFSVGAIDPVLKMDWSQLTAEMSLKPVQMQSLFTELNQCGGDRDQIKTILAQLDSKSVSYIAMEVAREFAEFQDRKNLH